MQNPHRRLLILVLLCLVLLGLVVVGKIAGDSRSDTRGISASPDNSSRSETPLPPIDNGSPSSQEKPVKQAPAVPSDGVSALAYIAANVVTGEVYVQRNEKQVLPVASMSKLVTAFAATDILSGTTSITITKEEASAPPDGSGIYAGETYTMNELLYPLLLSSSNIAAEALASSTDRANFLELMSSYAWEIGMSKAYFADPSGVSPHNAADAEDLVALAKYLYKFRPDILELTRTPEAKTATTTQHGSHDFVSIHPFVKDPNFLGGKTGHTPEAGDTMLTIFNVGGQPVAIVVLGSDSGARAADTSRILGMVKKEMGI